MTKKTMKHLQTGPLEQAKALIQSLGDKDYQVPQVQKEAPEHAEPSSSEANATAKSAKRPAKIRFNRVLSAGVLKGFGCPNSSDFG